MHFRPDCTPVQVLAALKEALSALDRAEYCAVLWFAEIHRRRLFRQFGYSSMNQFATAELHFSRTRTGDFLRLAARLEELPAIREALTRGLLGYSKALEIIRVATPATEHTWVAAATSLTRSQLRARIKRIRERARKRRLNRSKQPELENLTGAAGAAGLPELAGATEMARAAEMAGPAGAAEMAGSAGSAGAVPGRNPGQGGDQGPGEEVVPAAKQTSGTREQQEARPRVQDPANRTGSGSPESPKPAASSDHLGLESVREIPVHLGIAMLPEQLARFEALLEKLRGLGFGVSGPGRAEVILAGLAALVQGETRTTDQTTPSKTSSSRPGARRRAPAGSPVSRSSRIQIHVLQCPDCKGAAIRTGRGELPISNSTFQRLACDARIRQEGLPNRSTIAPSTRLAVLERDRYHCQAPGCRHVHHLEIHHIVPRSRGGSNQQDNLITLCSGCHRIWHEKGGPPPGWIIAAGS